MATHFSRAGCSFLAGLDGGVFGSAVFMGWEGVLLATHFSRPGRGCFRQRIFRGLGGVAFDSALAAGWEGAIPLDRSHFTFPSILAAHFSRAWRECFWQRTIRGLGGVVLGSACIFRGLEWKGVLLATHVSRAWMGVCVAAHFSRAGKGCFWQRTSRALESGVFGSAFFAG